MRFVECFKTYVSTLVRYVEIKIHFFRLVRYEIKNCKDSSMRVKLIDVLKIRIFIVLIKNYFHS